MSAAVRCRALHDRVRCLQGLVPWQVTGSKRRWASSAEILYLNNGQNPSTKGLLELAPEAYCRERVGWLVGRKG
ncbi:hypothetical protein chiPu_0025868 [Chiloscyllium punctatum]|uniref:Uncharacterized protein n=1 Tax=Chiloscyllium punctatum TaxID=137246 RepID=A0A401TGU1_CHIPU|nr:hypothetical protein [Chiloscyllium punctatum]